MKLRDQQIADLIKYLEHPKREEETVEQVATYIVNSLHDGYASLVSEAPPTLHVGEAFKCAITNKVHFVAWTDGKLSWITSADSRYGYLGDIEVWKRHATSSKAKSGAPGTNDDGWQVGEEVSHTQGLAHFTVIAVAPKCVLLWDGNRPWPETNDTLARLYRRETPKVSLF